MSTQAAIAPAVFPPTASTFLLPGPAGVLELATDQPAPALARAGTAVICHPHSQQGGTMQNKVVTTLERSLRELGLATIRFNFRCVGASSGDFDNGVGEVDDIRAVVAWARAMHPNDAIWLGGFSFGSYVALRAAAALEVAQLITIAPPVGRWAFDEITLPACPWLLVQGEQDEIVDPAAVFAWVETLADPPTVVRMPETTHFFHHRLLDLRAAVQAGVHAPLPALRAAPVA